MMIALIGILSLVSVFTAKSSALSCIQCAAESSKCSGNSITCPAGLVCGSSYTETTVSDGIKSFVFVRSCVASSECNMRGSMSINGGKTRSAISCCSTDGCTPTVPTLPTNSASLNGLVCQSCVSVDSAWCYTSDTIQCTGDENMCLLQTIETGSGPTAIRGCSTKSFCDIGSQFYNTGGTSVKYKFICTSGSLSAYRVVLTPAIVCLLLLKLFF